MPDNLPPSGWGPSPSEARDLDAVLAGQMTDIPIALRPVADVLAALRASPAPAELRGEANVMAEFRAHGPGGVLRPMGPAPTRPLSMLPDGPSPRRRPTRRHGRRHKARPAGHWAGALTGIAAAAAIVIVVAFTGNLPANLERLAHLGPTGKPSAATASPHALVPKTETTSASQQPTTPPPATHPAASSPPGPSAICREYYDDITQPGPASRQVTEISLWQQLAALTGTQSPRQVYRLCFPYLDGLFPQWTPELSQNPAAPHANAGNQGSNQSALRDNPGSQDNSGGQNNSGNQNNSGAQNGLLPGDQPGSAGPMH